MRVSSRDKETERIIDEAPAEPCVLLPREAGSELANASLMLRGCLMFPDRLTLVLLLVAGAARLLVHPPAAETFAFLYLVRISMLVAKFGKQQPTP